MVVVLGTWTLYAQVCVVAQASFTTLKAFSWLPLVFSAMGVWKTASPVRLPETCATAARRARHSFLSTAGWQFGAPFTITVLYAITRLDLLFWGLATGYLTAEFWLGQRSETISEKHDPPKSRFEVTALLALCALAALLTAGTRRPNGDDAYYLNVAAAEEDSPDVALQSFDALHRGGLPPVEETLHLPQTYEILVGLVANVSGASARVLYYLILPPLWAVFATLANWLVLRYLLARSGAIIGTAILIFLFVFWGDGVRTFGNFGFVRLFQGKAIYLTVALPLLVLAALRYRQRPGPGTWLALALSQCAATGLTANGVVVAPLAAALVILAPTNTSVPTFRTSLAGLAASVPLLFVAAAMYPRLAPYRSAIYTDDVLFGYTTTLGATRTPLILLAFTLLPALASRARLKCAAWIAGYCWLVVLVIFMPLLAVAGSVLLGNVYSWRLLWAVPLPLFVSIAGGIAAGSLGKHRWQFRLTLLAWAAVFVAAGPVAISGDRFAFRNLSRLKVYDLPYAVAEKVVALARRDAPALVPETVAIYVAGFPEAPPLVGVRERYLRKLRGFIPADQFSSRAALFRYISARNPAIPVSLALKMIHAQGIATVVFREAHRDSAVLVSALTERGFAIHRLPQFVIAAWPR
jgi:hypothetical protein